MGISAYLRSVAKTPDGISISTLVSPKRARIPYLWLPVGTKIVIPYLLLALIILVGAGYVVSQLIFDTLEARFNSQLAESSELASRSLVREQNQMLATLRLLAYTDGMAEAIQQKDARLLRDLSIGIAVDHRASAVEYLDAFGNLVYSMRHRDGGNIEDYDYLQAGGPPYLAFDFVKFVLDRTANLQKDKFNGIVHLDTGDYFFISGPVLDRSGQLAGVVLVGQPLGSLAQKIHQASLSQVSFYDSTGLPLYSTFVNPQPLQIISPTEAEKPAESQTGTNIVVGQSDKRDLTLENIGYSEVFKPWQMGEGEKAGLMGEGEKAGLMGIAVGRTFLISANRITRIQATGLITVVIVFVVLIGLSVARLITGPIKALVKASNQVASGQLEVQVNTFGNDEIGQLAKSFNDMVANLNESKQDLINSYDSTLEGWSNALEMRDHNTEGHSARVTEVSVNLGRRLGLSEEELVNLRRGAMLHDIGKMAIPDEILNKPGSLSPQEWEIMLQHPTYAYQMLAPIHFLRSAMDVPYYHHERWDGQGYPKRLKGEEIPLGARIFSIVDVWDAMSTDRPYRKAIRPEEVADFIRDNRGIRFDPRVVDTFFVMMAGQAGWEKADR